MLLRKEKYMRLLIPVVCASLLAAGWSGGCGSKSDDSATMQETSPEATETMEVAPAVEQGTEEAEPTYAPPAEEPTDLPAETVEDEATEGVGETDEEAAE